MPPEFECRREVTLPASPEEVWDAVATTAGNAGWLFPNEIAPDGSGATAWEPPHHFAVRMEQGDWFNALEFVIEGRGGGTSLLRYAHGGIFVNDWDSQYDAVQQHTDFYLHTLSEYLEHFNGRPATYIGGGPGGLQGPPGSASLDGFRRLQRALGLGEGVRRGDPVRLAPKGLPPIDGTVDYLEPNFVGVRGPDALYRFFGRNAFGGPVGMSIHVFADGVDAEKITRDWQDCSTTRSPSRPAEGGGRGARKAPSRPHGVGAMFGQRGVAGEPDRRTAGRSPSSGSSLLAGPGDAQEPPRGAIELV